MKINIWSVNEFYRNKFQSHRHIDSGGVNISQKKKLSENLNNAKVLVIKSMTRTEQKQGNETKKKHNMTLRKVPQYHTKAATIEHLYLVACKKKNLVYLKNAHVVSEQKKHAKQFLIRQRRLLFVRNREN